MPNCQIAKLHRSHRQWRGKPDSNSKRFFCELSWPSPGTPVTEQMHEGHSNFLRNLFFVSLAVFFTGSTGLAAVLCMLGLIIESVGMALTGKQSNDGLR